MSARLKGDDSSETPARPGGALRILHIAPHLSHRVGHAHAALLEAARTCRGAMARAVHTYVVAAEQPPGHAERITRAGGRVIVAPGRHQMSELVATADIVQMEWSAGASLPPCFAQGGLPPLRLAIWVHDLEETEAGVVAALAGRADATLLASPALLELPGLACAIENDPASFCLANARFGFAATERPACPTRPPVFGYVGPLDEADALGRLLAAVDAATNEIRVSLWGTTELSADVASRVAAMRHPRRIRIEGSAHDREAVLKSLDMLLDLRDRRHMDAGLLVEAMSLGATPVVWRHAVEAGLLREGRNGLVVESVEECAALLDWARTNPRRIAKLGSKAMYDMAHTHTPAVTLRALQRTYATLMARPKRWLDFATQHGSTTAMTFAASFGGERPDPACSDTPPQAAGQEQRGRFHCPALAAGA